MSHSPYKLAPGEQVCPICNILMGPKRLARPTEQGYCTFCETDIKKRQHRMFRNGVMNTNMFKKETLIPVVAPQSGSCARPECGQVLSHAQIVKGNKFCSRRCAALARNNQPNTKVSWAEGKKAG
jgi:hypothetical protein